MLQKTITTCFLLLSIVSFGQITDFKAPAYSSIEKDIQNSAKYLEVSEILLNFASQNHSLIIWRL